MDGQTISHYRVIRTLGSGGMGVVYEAEDLDLDRRVALKVLPSELALDEGRRQRFTREAKAVAALNHPNIVTVFAVEEFKGQHFITMEMVEGRTLLAIIPRKGLPLGETLKLAVQLADALSAAHERGITHRDIKPANIMVSPAGRVKVLDFGLAKLREDGQGDKSTTATGAAPATGEGRIVGTVAYMSPEQAQAAPTDYRSDIFSLGIVLYEMATGARPFVGDTNVAVLASIVKDAPKLASDVNAEVPIELARIIRRCLQKDRERRYQSAKDLRNELAELKEESASGELVRARAVPATGPVRRRGLLISGALIVAMAAVVFGLAQSGWLVFGGPADGSDATSSGPTGPGIGIPGQVTSAPGWEAQPALSPDGSLVAYASNESGNSDIWLVGFRGGGAVPLAADPATDEKPAWFPDGSALVFASDRGGRWNIWKVPVLGGSPSLLVQNARDPAISASGDQIAFVRSEQSGEQRVYAGPLADPGRARRVADGPARALQPEEDPAWSPNGQRICYSADRGLWTVSAAGGSPTQVTRDREYDIEPTWAADGQSLYFAAYRGGVFALWQVAASGGVPHRLTRGAGPERHPSVSRDCTRLAFSTFTTNADLVLHDLASGREERIGTTRDEVCPAFSHDGLWIVFVVDTGPAGGTELWMQPIAGSRSAGQPHRLAEIPGAVSHPEFSPDDRFVAFQRTLAGSRDIWIVPMTGGTPIRFTDDPADDLHPIWAPDGRSIAFVSLRGGETRVWTAPVADGRPAGPARRITSGHGSHGQPVWSSDGTRIAYVAEDATGADVWIAGADGSGPAKRITSGASAGFVRWDAHGRSLIVSGTWGEAAMSLRRVNLATGVSQPLNPAVRIGPPSAPPMFDVSPDGRVLTVSRGDWTGDVWVSEVLRKRP